jgi:hypothetical protein
VPFSRRNLIILRTSMFDHVSASPAILQLMLGQYDWYEVRFSVRERKQCSTCSDLAGNLNEIRNIKQVRGLVTSFIESPYYYSYYYYYYYYYYYCAFFSGLLIHVILHVGQIKVRTCLGGLKLCHVYWCQQDWAHPEEVCVRLLQSFLHTFLVVIVRFMQFFCSGLSCP